MSGSSRQSGTSEKSLCRRLKIASALRCLRIPILPFCFFSSRLVIPIGSNHKPSPSESPAFSEHRQKFSYFFLKSQKKAFEFYSLSEDLYEEEMLRRTVFKAFGHKRELLHLNQFHDCNLNRIESPNSLFALLHPSPFAASLEISAVLQDSTTY